MDGGEATKLELLQVAIRLLEEKPGGDWPLLSDLGLQVTVHVGNGASPGNVVCYLGSGHDGLLDAPVVVEMDAWRRAALAECWQCLTRRRTAAVLSCAQDNDHDDVAADGPYFDAHSTTPLVGWPLQLVFSTPGVTLRVGLDAHLDGRPQTMAVGAAWASVETGRLHLQATSPSSSPLPMIDAQLEGVELALAPSSGRALRLALGHLTAHAGESKATVALESTRMVLGATELMQLQAIRIEASSSTTATVAARPDPARGVLAKGFAWPPQRAGDWASAKAPLWDIRVTLPAMHASLDLDHVLEALWVVASATQTRSGGSSPGVVTTGAYKSRRQRHVVPATPLLAPAPLLRVHLTLSVVDVAVLPGTRREGLSAIGPIVRAASMPWYAHGAAGHGGPLLRVHLPQGLKAAYTTAGCGLTPVSFSARIDLPALHVSTVAEGPTATRLAMLDVAGLQWSLRSFPDRLHWTPMPGSLAEAFWVGVGELSHSHAFTVQHLAVGLEPTLVARLVHVAQAMAQVATIYAQSRCGATEPGHASPVRPSVPCVPLGPVLSLDVSLPATTRVNLCWGETTLSTVAEVVLKQTQVSMRAGGGRLTLSGSVHDLGIVDGRPLAPELGKILCRLQETPGASPLPSAGNMVTWRFEGKSEAASGGEGPRVLVRAGDWRFVYLQRVTMELVNYVKDYLVPSFARAARPQDALSGSVVHWLATTPATTPAKKPVAWIQGIPKAKSALSTPPVLPPSQAFRLQVLLVNSRALLANSSRSPEGLIVDFERYRLWRVPHGAMDESFWKGAELEGHGRETTAGAGGNAAAFQDPCNDPHEMAVMAQVDLEKLVQELQLLVEEERRLGDVLQGQQAALEAVQTQVDSLLDAGRPVPGPLSPGGLSGRLAVQMTAVDELERRLREKRAKRMLVASHVEQLEAELARWQHVAASAARDQKPTVDNPRWQHGQALPLKPPNRLDMDLRGAAISTWKAGLVGKHIAIHGYIETGRLRFPGGDPPGLYPEVYTHLGFQRYLAWNTNNTGVVVALFVHELDWILSRGQYADLLELLMANTREPCAVVPPLHPVPLPPEFGQVEPGPGCITLPPCVSVPVFFKHAVVRLVEDVFPDQGVELATGDATPAASLLATDGRDSASTAAAMGWSEDEDEQDSDEEEEEDVEEHMSAIGAEEGQDQDDDLPSPSPFSPQRCRHGAGDGDFLSARQLLGMPQRDVRQLIVPEEYVATVVLGVACLSIDRRPDGMGLELGVTAEHLVVENEVASLADLWTGRASAATTTTKILFPSADLVQGAGHPPSAAGPDGAQHGSATTTASSPRLPEGLQARYLQQSVGPYRRCLVELGRSVVVGAGDRLSRVVDFFVQPVRARNAMLPPPPTEQPKYLDVEASLEESLACFAEDYQRPSSAALFVHLQFDYMQKWRGLVEGGPGTVDATIDVGLQSVFFSRQGMVLGRCLPLTSPFMFQLQMLTDVLRRNAMSPPDRYRSLVFKVHKIADQFIRTRASSPSEDSPQGGGRSTPKADASPAEVHFSLSVPDFRLFLKQARRLAKEFEAGRQWNRALEIARAQDSLALAAATGPSPSTTVAPPTGQLLETASAHVPAAPDPGPATLQESRSTTQIFVTFDDLQFTLVNHSLGVPIASLAVLSTDFRLQQQDTLQSLDMAGSMALRAGYFNQRTYKWESVLETVALSAETTRKGAGEDAPHASAADKDDGTLHIQLNSLEPLNVNVTHALLSLARNEALVTDLLAKRTSRSAPYVVRNRSGELVQVAFHRNHRLVHTCTLAPDEDTPFDFRDVVAAMLFQGACSHTDEEMLGGANSKDSRLTHDFLHSLSFQLERGGSTFHSADALSMDVVGLYDVRMALDTGSLASPLPSLPPPTLITDVELQADGSKVLTLRSRTCIQNKSGAPMHLLITTDPTQREAPCEEVVVLPEETKYVPVSQLGPNTSFFVRASPNVHWAPIFANIGELDAFMDEAGNGAASLVCECPPLDNVPVVPNDDSEDVILAGSYGVGVEVRTEDTRGSTFGTFADATVLADLATTARDLQTTMFDDDGDEEEDEEDEDAYARRGNDDSSRKHQLSDTCGQTLYVKRHDATSTSLTLRNLAATIRRTASGGGASRSHSLLRSSSSFQSPAAKEPAGEGAPASGVLRSCATRLILRPVFVLHNLYPCPLLYRLCDKNGFVTAEGTLPVGASLPLFQASVKTKQYLSVRMANFLWSTFVRVHSPKTPYPLQERVSSMDMKGLQKMKGGGATFSPHFDLPPQVVHVSLVGRHIRLYAKVALVNRSSILLDYRDGSMAADVNLAVSSPSYLRHAPLPIVAEGTSPWPVGVTPTGRHPVAGALLARTPSATFGPLSPKAASTLSLSSLGRCTPPDLLPKSPLAVAVRLPYNHLDTVALQLPDDATLRDVFLALTQTVYVLHGAGLEDFEFVRDSTPADVGRCQAVQNVASSLSPRKSPFTHPTSGPLAEQLQQGLKAALGSNRANLYEAEQAHAMCFLAQSSPLAVFDKWAGTLGSLHDGGGVALRLVHRAELDVTYQVAQACRQTEVVHTLESSVQTSASVGQHKKQGPSSARTPAPPFFDALTGGASEVAPRQDSENMVVQYQRVPCPGLPFSPPTVFGHGVQLALRCWDSEWSGPLDAPQHLAAGSKVYSYISLKQRGAASRDHKGQYDLGLVMAQCEAPFQRTSLLTFVPRYVLVNRLDAAALEFAQTACMDSWVGTLHPGEEAPFHWPWTEKKKLIQVRLSTASTTPEDAWQWSGDFSIDSVGELHIKMRKAGNTPHDKRIVILRVNIELIQASIVVTFSGQDPEWPPYRVDNLTSYNIRYRQTASLLSGLGPLGEHDYLPPNASAAFAWDVPTSASKLLQLEFQQGSKWEQREYSLDELKQHSRVKLSRALPDLSHPLYEGKVELFRPQTDAWVRVFAVLKGPVLYVFADEHKMHLRGVVNLSSRMGGPDAAGTAADGSGKLRKRAIISQHKAAVVDVFSIIKSTFDRTTNKLNAMLLTGEEDEQQCRQQKKKDQRREVLGMVAYQLGRFLLSSSTSQVEQDEDEDEEEAGDDASDVAVAPTPARRSPTLFPPTPSADLPSSSTPSGPILKTPLLTGSQWLGVLTDSGYARNEDVARRLAIDLFFAGHFIPFSVVGPTVLSPQRRRLSVARHDVTGSSLERRTPLQPRPPSGPPPQPSSSHLKKARSNKKIGSPSFVPAKHGGGAANGRRQSVGGNDSFTLADTTLYMLVVPLRDADIDLSQDSAFDVVTAYGDKSIFRCGSTLEMKQWMSVLRDTVDRLVISSTLAGPPSSSEQPTGRGGSKSTLSGRLLAMIDPPAAAPATPKAGATSVPAKAARTSVRVSVRADGPTKVLELIEEHDGEEADDEHLARRSQRLKPGMGEAQPLGLFRKTTITVYVRRVGLSLVDDKPQETLYASLDHINLRTDLASEHLTVGLTVEGIQLDNQLENAGYTVVLAPRAVPAKRGESGGQPHQLVLAGLAPRPPELAPAFHFYTRKVHVNSQDILFFEAFTCWLRPLELKVEESVVTSVLRFKNSIQLQHLSASLRDMQRAGDKKPQHQPPATLQRQAPAPLLPLPPDLDGNDVAERLGLEVGTRGGSRGEEGTRRWLLPEQELALWHQPRAMLSAQLGRHRKLYFAVLHLHPIDLTVSFKYMALQEAKDEDKEVVALGNMAQLDNARVRLNALVVTDAFGGQRHIVDVILKHYAYGVVKQLHHVLGSFDLIGNPVGLVSNLGTGVKDFFYEPWEGLASDGSLEAFLGGVGKGTNSLLGNAVDGTMTTTSNITKTLGHGLASLTLDPKYKHDRVRRKAQEAQTVKQGLVQGGRELGRGLYEGLTGMILAPVRGAERDGVVGFGKGLVKGLVGAAVKPAVGMVDFASKASEGIKNYTRADILQSRETMARGKDGRVRPPRALGQYGELKEYDLGDALAQQTLHSVLGGHFKKEHIWAQFKVPGWPLGLHHLEIPQSKLERAFKGELLEAARAEDVLATVSTHVDLGPLFEVPSVAEQTQALGLLPESHVDWCLIVSEVRLLLVREGEPQQLVWEAPLDTVVDVAAVSLAGCHAIRFGLGVPVLLADGHASGPSLASTSSLFPQAHKKKAEKGLLRLPVVHDPALQLEYWFSALLETVLPSRFAALQRLTPSDEACIMRGYLERRKGGHEGSVGGTHMLSGAGSQVRSWYVLAGNVLYEYKVRQKPTSLHMAVPLAGLRVSQPSTKTIRLARARSGETTQVIKCHRTGGLGEGEGDAAALPLVTNQTLSESQKGEILLVAPDAVSARQWAALLARSIVDERPLSSPKAVAAPCTGQPTLGSEGRGGMSMPSSSSPPTSPRHSGPVHSSRRCLLYVPFDPAIQLEAVEAVLKEIQVRAGLHSSRVQPHK